MSPHQSVVLSSGVPLFWPQSPPIPVAPSVLLYLLLLLTWHGDLTSAC
jgi:hypothetical protein